MSNASRVPIEFRAQVPGRAQRQYIKKPHGATSDRKSDIQLWIDQWIERVDPQVPFTGEGLHIVEAQIDWRLISNSGIAEGIIRPVIGAGGWPMLPGSGIKGLFRRACSDEKMKLRWCGSPSASDDLNPGLLRFHGAWPADNRWTQGLLDVAHPQQNWQVGFKADQRQNGHSAFGVVSLHQPLLLIGLSSTQPLDDEEWSLIKSTLKSGLERGLGGRTVAGYGSSGKIEGDVLFQCGLEGQGPAAKLLDGTPEFRPTMFRAAIRGMALRLFGGLTDERTAQQVVGEIFGSLSREEDQNVGLLATAYTSSQTSLGRFGSGTWAQPVFTTSGQLQWRRARKLHKGEDTILLAELLAQLHGLVMSLGGFGRGWRRPDHRIFMSEYTKTPIGTHWQWLTPSDLPKGLHVQSAADIERLLRQAQATAKRWLAAVNRPAAKPAPWREVLAPDRVDIWVREATGPEDAEVIRWFHKKPEADNQGNMDPRDLNKTNIGGCVNLVSRIWNRLLPLTEKGEGPRALAASAGGSSARQAPGGAFARPSGPGGAFARPKGGSSDRPRQQQPTGPVSINVWGGPYLEFVVLFVDPQDLGHGPALKRRLDEGANAGFRRIKFTDS